MTSYEHEFPYPISGLGWSPAGRVAVASFCPRGGNEVTVLQLPAVGSGKSKLGVVGCFEHGAAVTDAPSQLAMAPVDLAWSPSQSDVLVTAADRFVLVWNVRAATEATKQRRAWVKAAQGGGAQGGAGCAPTPEPGRPAPLASLESSHPLLSCDWGEQAGDGASCLATAATDGAVQVWDMAKATGRARDDPPERAAWRGQDLQRGAALHVRWEPGSKYVLASCHADGTIAKWDTRQQSAAALIRQDASAGGARHDPAPPMQMEWGAQLAGGGRAVVLLLGGSGGVVVGDDRFERPFVKLGGDSAMPGGATAAVCCRGEGASDWVFAAEADGTASFFDCTGRQEVREYKAGRGRINRIAWGTKEWACLSFQGQAGGSCLQVVPLGFR